MSSLGVLTQSNDPVVGLDVRPSDNQLYAATESGRLFSVTVPTDGSALSFRTLQALDNGFADSGGFDFNPASDALRVISRFGNNTRVPTAALAHPAPFERVRNLNDGIMGYRLAVSATARFRSSNIFIAVDDVNDDLYYKFESASASFVGSFNGLLFFSTGLKTVSNEDVNVGPDNGLDSIAVNVGGRLQEEVYLLDSRSTQTSTEIFLYRFVIPETNDFASDLSNARLEEIYNVDAPGVALSLGLIPAYTEVRGLVVDAAEGAMRKATAIATTAAGQEVVLEFDFNSASTSNNAAARLITIQGLNEDEKLLGLAKRRNSLVSERQNVLYALSSQNRVFALLPVIGSGSPQFRVADPVALTQPLTGNTFAIDFSNSDLLVIKGQQGQHVAVNLQFGREIGREPEVNREARVAGFVQARRTTRVEQPKPNASGLVLRPEIIATAYRAAPKAEDGTFQFAIDRRDSTLARVVSPNDGALVTVGPSGLGIGIDVEEGSFDIAGPEDALVYAALRTAGSNRSALYRIDLNSGVAELLGAIGAVDSRPVSSITVRFE